MPPLLTGVGLEIAEILIGFAAAGHRISLMSARSSSRSFDETSWSAPAERRQYESLTMPEEVPPWNVEH
jgi:hypothetical protein